MTTNWYGSSALLAATDLALRVEGTLVSLTTIGGTGCLCVNAKVYKGSIGSTVNIIELGLGPTELAIA